jgi:hypothetical protein
MFNYLLGAYFDNVLPALSLLGLGAFAIFKPEILTSAFSPRFFVDKLNISSRHGFQIIGCFLVLIGALMLVGIIRLF